MSQYSNEQLVKSTGVSLNIESFSSNARHFKGPRSTQDEGECKIAGLVNLYHHIISVGDIQVEDE